MSREPLDRFGELLIQRVRDEAITDWQMLIRGDMKGVRADRLRQRLAAIDRAARDTLLSLLPDIVDTVLHHLLWTLEQNTELTVGIQMHEDFFPNVSQMSDGLPGELYTDKGWIARFSKAKI